MASINQTTARVAVRNALWFSIGSYLTQFIAFVATLFLTRQLGPTVFGLLAIGSFWSTLLSLEPKFGIYYAAIQYPKLDGELLGTYYTLELVLAAGSFIVSIVAAVVLVSIGYAFEVGLILVFIVGMAGVNAFVSPLGMALEKELQLSRQTLAGIVASLLAYGVALTLAFMGAGIWSLLAMTLVITLAGMVGTYVVCRRRLPAVFQMHWHFSPSLARQMIKQGLPVGLSNVTTTSIVNQFDNFLIGTFVSTTELGYYDRAFRLSQWPNTLLTLPVTKLSLLTFAKVKDDLPRLTAAVRLALWMLVTLGPAIALFLLLGAPDIITILYTPVWARSAYYLQFLAVYSFLSPFIAMAYSLGIAKVNRRFIITLTATEAAILILCGTPLTLWLGANGTLITVGLMNVAGFMLACRYIFQVVPLKVREVFGRAFMAAAVAIALTFVMETYTGWHNLPSLERLIITTMTGPGVFVLANFALNPAEMIERVRYLIKTFRKPGAEAGLL